MPISWAGNRYSRVPVPIESLFDHLEAGVSLDEFPDEFDTVTKIQAVAVLEIANRFMTSKNIATLYETAA